MFSLIGTPAFAQSALTNNAAFNAMNNQEKIAFLYGMIAQLQVILELRMQAENAADSSDADNRSDLEVDTKSATDIEEDEATLRAEVDLDGEDEALVWFEYGDDDDDLDDRTTKRSVDEDDGDVIEFDEIIDDLDEGERYYFRAVAEDEDGDRSYGTVRNFRTDGEDDSDDEDDDSDSTSASSGDFELTVSDTLIEAGDEVEVDWEIPSNDEGVRNWIGLYEVGSSNSGFESWEYIDDDSSGTVAFTIDNEGEYEFRLFLDDSYDDEVTSAEVEVE